mgnify:CR=1 FL=1
MKKVFAAFASVVLFALVGFTGVAANAAAIERTISPSNHVVISFEMPCKVFKVEHKADMDVVHVEDNSENIWSFYCVEKGYWKPGDTLRCIFDYCQDCETLELNCVVE